MRKTTLKFAFIGFMLIASALSSQIDLTIGLNYGYNPPSSCNNKITGLYFDVCNNGSSASGAFVVGVYLYDPGSQKHWVVDQVSVNSLSGNACKTISNWDVDMNSFCCLPSPGTNYRIGVWADTANTIAETTKNNNASLLSGNIQICAGSVTGLTANTKLNEDVTVFPNPINKKGYVTLDLKKAETVEVKLFDLDGKEVLSLINENLNQGQQKIELNTTNLKEDVYLLKIIVSDSIIVKKIIISKAENNF